MIPNEISNFFILLYVAPLSREKGVYPTSPHPHEVWGSDLQHGADYFFAFDCLTFMFISVWKVLIVPKYIQPSSNYLLK